MQWNEDQQVRYQGRSVFSIFPREHASWCHLTLIQGSRSALVMLATEEENPGTVIAIGAEVLATQIVNGFDLEPATTLFVERTPPRDTHAEMRQWAAQELPASMVSTLYGTSEDIYERITFEWSEAPENDGPRHVAWHPVWKRVKPVEVIGLVHEL